MSSINYSNQFLAALHTQFQMPDYTLSSLALYKRLVWNASYFLSQWESNVGTYAAGTIRKYNDIYHVNFHPRCNIGRIKSLLAEGYNPQVTLSFRKAKNPSLPCIVIVDFHSDYDTEE